MKNRDGKYPLKASFFKKKRKEATGKKESTSTMIKNRAVFGRVQDDFLLTCIA
jgi:hypothetical protein